MCHVCSDRLSSFAHMPYTTASLDIRGSMLGICYAFDSEVLEKNGGRGIVPMFADQDTRLQGVVVEADEP